jgi:hypothetical protein
LDLSFDLGVPLHWLRSMPLPDLQLYRRYTERRGFPGRRIELLLAQVALVLAQVNGNREARLTHFLFDPPPDDEAEETDLSPDEAAEQVAALMGYRPRRPPATQTPRETTDGQ